MNGRRFRSTFQLAFVLLITASLYFYYGRTSSIRPPSAPLGPVGTREGAGNNQNNQNNVTDPAPSQVLSSANVSRYIQAILDPKDTGLPRLDCPRPDLSRYEYLKEDDSSTDTGIRYFFALNLRQCLPVLPRLIGSIVEALRFLGPENCAVSVVEGKSPDGTGEVLAALRPELDKLLPGRVHLVLSNDIDPLEGDGVRFKKLAELRNMALQPMLDKPRQHLDATVVFINDVAICLDDILELIHQRIFLESDMTCAMDWVPGFGGEPIFYDSFISRSLNGDLFFNIPPETASYSQATDLFWSEPKTRAKFDSHQPFQVFACWNGAVAITASPMVDGKVSFRPVFDERGECVQGEPQLFCKDLWFQGHGKIAVVPSVNLAYSTEEGVMAKAMKGYTSHWTSQAGWTDEKIEWQPPPALVKCMPTVTDQTWRPWNETLV